LAHCISIELALPGDPEKILKIKMDEQVVIQAKTRDNDEPFVVTFLVLK